MGHSHYYHDDRNTRPIAVLSLAGDIEPRASCATFALRLPPRQRSSPRARLPIVLELKVRTRSRLIISLPTTVCQHLVMSHYRTLLDRHQLTAITPSMVSHRVVLGRRGRLIGRPPAMARFRSTVRHHSAIYRRHTLTGRHADTGMGCRRRDMCYRRTLMGRRPAMARLPATVHHLAWASRHRTLLSRHPAMAHLLATVRHRRMVPRHALMINRRTQFPGRARMLAA